MPRCDIGYLLRAESDAFSVLDDPDAAATWDYACEYRVLYKFQSPVTKKDLDHIPQFQDWRPHRGRFQRRAFRIDDAYWQRLTALLSKKNPGFAKNLKEVEGSSIAIRVALEEELESILAADLGRLSRQGYDLELVGRQLVCPEIKSRIDLLCRDRSKKRFVVVELKNERAGRATFSQIWSYMSWVKEHRSGGKPVLGLVISRGADNQFLACLRDCDNIRQVDLKDLGFE